MACEPSVWGIGTASGSWARRHDASPLITASRIAALPRSRAEPDAPIEALPLIGPTIQVPPGRRTYFLIGRKVGVTVTIYAGGRIYQGIAVLAGSCVTAIIMSPRR